jgi:methylamine---glutamate N-methyltransferase subunit B
VIEYKLDSDGVRGLNQTLHDLGPDTNERHWLIRHPMGAHAIAVGLDAPSWSKSTVMLGFIAPA